MHKKPSDFELQILSILWNQGDLTEREVLERLSDGKKRAYTSVLSVMQVMEKKGLLQRSKPESGNANIWRAKVDRDTVTPPLMRRLVDQVFAGKPSAVMQQMLSADAVNAGELAEIRKLLAEYEARSEGRDPD